MAGLTRVQIAAAVYAAVTLFVWWAVYDGEGRGLAYMFGSATALFGIAYLGVFLVTLKRATWPPRRRVALALLIAGGLMIVARWDEISAGFQLRRLTAEIEASRGPDDAIARVAGSDTNIGRTFASAVTLMTQTHDDIAAKFLRIESDPVFSTALLPSTVADPAALRRAHGTIYKYSTEAAVIGPEIAGQMARLRAQVEEIARRHMRDQELAGFLRGFGESHGRLESWYARRSASLQESVGAIAATLAVLLANHGSFTVEADGTVVFNTRAMADDYNAAQERVQRAIETEDALNAELGQIRTEIARMDWLRKK